MTIWAIYVVTVMMAARVVGGAPAEWPGTYLIAPLFDLMPY